MDGVYKELEELKEELDRLKEEYRIKTELSENLRRAHTDQLSKSEEAKLEIKRQAKELNEKSEEIDGLRQLYGEAESKIHEMESSLKQVSSMNEKIRIDAGEKVQRFEEENRKLVSALDEATGRNDDLEGKLCACNKEVEGLKNLLSESQKKCLELEEKARAGRELRHREEVISKLEVQSMSIQDQLKWKKEQFEHLEEAHKRLQDLFQSSKKEWASEKSGMLEEITTLQLKLDSQIRITENLESRLKMCNQALAHEESRRRTLEFELSESKQSFKSVLAEYEETKTKFESLSTKRDEDIAGLRNTLGMKEIMLKEMEYRVTHLEQENKELLGSLKELREAQINKRKADPSLNKLRNKLKDVEQVHSNCSLVLKEREVEWNSKMEKLLGDLKSYESDIKRQSEQLDQLKQQLDDCHSSMEVSDEEASILLLMMKSELSDAYSKLFNSGDQTFNHKIGEIDTGSAQILEMTGHCSPSSAQAHVKQAHEEIELMTQKLDSIKLLEERITFLESALLEHKKMLEESSACHLRTKEQVSQMEVALKDMSSSLEKSNAALAVKTSEATQAEMELQIWKSKAESFRTCLEQCQEVCKQMETSLLDQVETEKGLREENESLQCKMEEQDQEIKDLEQKTASVDHKLIQKEAAMETMKLEAEEANKKAEHCVIIMKERDSIVENMRKEIEAIEEQSMKRESVAAESARLEAESKFELEKEELLIQKEAAMETMKLEAEEANKKAEHYVKIIKERDSIVYNMQKHIEAIEEQSMKRESVAAEFARLEAESKFELEKEELCKTITAEKDGQIVRIQTLASSLEQDFMKVVLYSFSKSIEDMVKIVALQDALEKSELVMNTEMERKDNTVDVLKKEVSSLQGRILLQEESLFHSKQSVKELEALTEFKKQVTEKLLNQFGEEQTKLKEMKKELEQEKEIAVTSIKRLSFERDSLLNYIEGICDQFGDFCAEDVKLEGMLVKLLQNSGKDDRLASDYAISNKLSDHKDTEKVVEANGERSPLREINQ